MKNLTLTNDGTYTLYSKKYNQHYHSVKEGAINEALSKHIIPALNFASLHNISELNILDICFGLGYNTLSTIYYILENNIDIKVNFYSPEFDNNLIKSLQDFNYPTEFKNLKYIIDELSKNHFYKDDKFQIKLFIGNAREYIKTINDIDIVYQDAFSADVNKELWTKEYFEDIYKLTKKLSMITTYSIATPIRLSMYESGFYIFEYQSETANRQTLCFKNINDAILNNIKYIDMVLKQKRNTTAQSLVD
jgi:tRNA U34 5-methylaminomethyl-2-thiouridine-forming methyltransferase MnmC